MLSALLRGALDANAKVSIAAVSSLYNALATFGPQSVKPAQLHKPLKTLLGSAHPRLRQEGLLLTVSPPPLPSIVQLLLSNTFSPDPRARTLSISIDCVCVTSFLLHHQVELYRWLGVPFRKVVSGWELRNVQVFS